MNLGQPLCHRHLKERREILFDRHKLDAHSLPIASFLLHPQGPSSACGDGQRDLGVGEAELPSLPIQTLSGQHTQVSPPWGVPDAGSAMEPENFQQGSLDSHTNWRPPTLQHCSALELTFLILFLPIPKTPLFWNQDCRS